jgi:hypothetical protein
MTNGLTDAIVSMSDDRMSQAAQKKFRALIQSEQYVGELYSISYNIARVQIHDKFRQQVGGIPSQCFLIATRINPISNNAIDYKAEDSSVILLRVLDAAMLPSDSEAERIRVERGQVVTGELDQHWDGRTAMDVETAYYLGFAGVECRVIGTFYLDGPAGQVATPDTLGFRFGSDLSNYYPNRGLKIYKPNGTALRMIVNYQSLDRQADLVSAVSVQLGEVRYASTNRSFQGVSSVPVQIYPADLLGQKTALFGMTRVGKSNTVKIISKAVFDLRFEQTSIRTGQIIFDPNGEYANENVQDINQQKNPSALKNVWRRTGGVKEDVITYGIRNPSNDPDRKMMLINFYAEDMLQVGKDMVDSVLDEAKERAQYIQNFRQVAFEEPDKKNYDDESEYRGALTRYNRRVLVYRALLKRASFDVPAKLKQPKLMPK